MRSYRWLLAAWLVGLVGYEYLLLASTLPVAPLLRDGLLGTAVLATPLLVVHRFGSQDTWARAVEAGCGLFLLAHVLRLASATAGLDRLGLVASVVALLGALVLLVAAGDAVRHHLAGARFFVALDGLSGALAGAAAVTWAVIPLVGPLWDGSPAQMLQLAAPLLDVVLVAAAFGAVGLVGPGHGRPLGLFAAGTVLLAARDIGLAGPDGTDPASWLHGVGALALGLIALGAASGATDVVRRQLPGRRSLGVPALASGVAIAVLAAGPTLGEAPLPTVLALLTLAVCGARFVRAFLQLRELAVVREQAMTDELTGIANRRALYQHLDELLPEEDDEGSTDPTPVAVALIDLDHFKEVNDTLGHAAGDGLLKAVVARFAAALAELETPHLLARLGGDEFAVVLHEATSRNAAMIVGAALQDSLAEPVELPEGVLHAQASIGLAVAPQHGGTRGEILFAADAAMYVAKSSSTSVAFHAPPEDETSEQLTLAEELYRALDRHELTVEYQPIQRPDGTVLAAEAFVRWDHPERGRLDAAEFLEAAGRYKLTPAIAERVLDVALGDLSRWRAGGIPLTVSINLSPEDLRDESVVGTIAAALIAHGLPGEALTVDISETSMAEDPERVRAVMLALDEIGVRIALDDYGTGGVGLTDLTELPLAEIKLDRKFSRDTAVNTRSTNIVKSVLDLTHALGLRMVAEGVEDRRAHAVLKHLGCDLLQGRHLGRPMPAVEFEERLFRSTGGKHRLRV